MLQLAQKVAKEVEVKQKKAGLPEISVGEKEKELI